ncbi:MAG: FlgD immunoglobulin-like domain containing protein [Candidatus Krumholzibacteriia bacterium]
MNRRLLALLFCSLAAVSTAASIRVPADAADLPSAIAVAADLDTIQVAASHQVAGGVVLPGRPLVILGGWDDQFTTVIGRTPLGVGSGAPSLSLAPPATGSPVVAGFVIAAGDGQVRTTPLPGRYGGGVLVEGGAPELRDLVITGGDLSGGGGLGCGGGLALIATDAMVVGCRLEQNRATWGGGVFVQGGAPTLDGLVVIDNRCGPDAAGRTAQGAGILVRQSSATVIGCEVRGGRDAVNGGGLAWLGSRGLELTVAGCEFADNTMARDGGGLYGQDGAVSVTDCLFVGNAPAPGAEFTSGGGAYLTGARALVQGAVFRDNRAAAGGGLTVNTGPEVTVAGCVFLANEAAQFGAGLNYQSNEAGQIADNTLAANVNPAGAGVLNLVNTSPSLIRNLVAFNTGGGVSATSNASVAACNDVALNSGAAWSGLPDPTGQDGNLAADPLFCDLAAGDLTLRDDSPCLDAPGCGGDIGALGVGCSIGVAAPAVGGPTAVAAFPNPANPAVTIRCTLPRAGRLRVAVHDARGRLVRRLIDAPAEAGTVDVRWDGRDDRGRAVASGGYVYRVVADGVSAAGRLTLLR